MAAHYLALVSLNEKRMLKTERRIEMVNVKRKLEAEKIAKESRKEAVSNYSKLLKAKKDLSAEDGVLHYKPRLDALKERLTADYKNAFDRLTVAKQGLKNLYDYENNSGFPSNNQSDFLEPIDKAVIWCRAAMQYLVRFGQLDQAVTFTISLRKSAGEKEFENWLEQSNSKPLSIKIEERLFAEHAFVRLRGVTMFSVPRNGGNNDVIAVTLRICKTGKVSWVDANGKVDTHTLDQSDLPTCRLGRIQPRNSPRPPEVGGLVSLLNASPIPANESDSWSVTLHDLPKNIRENILDLELELQILARPRFTVSSESK